MAMGSEGATKVPTVDFSWEDGLTPGTESWDRVQATVRQAAEEFGCFEVLYPAISVSDREALFSKLRELFALPVETKQKNAYKKPFHGYTGQRPQIPLFESLGIDGVDKIEDVESFSEVMWPEGNPGFSETVNSFAKKLLAVESIVRRMVLESYGVDKYFDSLTGSLKCLLRVMNYKPATGTESAIGLSPHTDMNFMTIICQDDVNGLEVLTKEGKYVPMTPSPNSLLVFVADSFMAWSNGRVRSSLHRVVSGNKERFSVGLFMIPKAGWKIKSPEELVDEEHPLLYKPFDHFDFLKFFYADPSKGAQVALKEHAGITA